MAQKLDWRPYQTWKKFHDMYVHCTTISARYSLDRQKTDRHQFSINIAASYWRVIK